MDRGLSLRFQNLFDGRGNNLGRWRNVPKVIDEGVHRVLHLSHLVNIDFQGTGCKVFEAVKRLRVHGTRRDKQHLPFLLLDFDMIKR